MAEQTEVKSYRFKAEITQVLDILVHSLYKDREIFLRELISNASDALTRIQFEMLTNQDVLDPEAKLAIHINVREEDDQKLIVIKDNGIGMTRDELVQNLGTIAQSGAREFLAQIEQEDVDPAEIIGQFGVGFYSVFMVAEEVRVVSRSFRKRAKPAAWVSEGGEEFQIEEADKIDRGTEIHIHLKDDAAEFADEFRLKQIIKKYSDFVGYPIYVGEDQANRQLPLWRKAPSEVNTEEYNQFYQQMTMDFEEPLAVVHLSSDAPLHVRALLYVPAKREKNVLNLRKEPGLQLYSHNVLIQEYSQDLLPKWLDFVDGVVESEDLPLNVSRESIQNTRVIRQLSRTIRKRTLKELHQLAEDDSQKYADFWHQYSRVLKEGLVTEPEAKDELLPLFRYFSTKSDETPISIDAYIKRIPEEQDEIYYVLGEDRQSVTYSPHLDPFKSRDIEVLYWIDPLDTFIAPILDEYKGKKLRNIDDASLELPEESIESEEDEESVRLAEVDFNLLVGRFVTTLGDRVIEVRDSKVLKNSPVRLVSPDDTPAREMERLYKYLDEEYRVPKRILEVNRQHPLIVNLASVIRETPDDEVINLTIEQLYESALVVEGLHPNPASMLPRVQHILELAVGRTPTNNDK
jgi:molecular chaperone HtpG